MTSSAADTPTTTRAKEIPKWTLKADYVETYNCDYGCSCNFTGWLPHKARKLWCGKIR